MRRTLLFTGLSLLLVACTNTEGLSPESVKPARGNLDSTVLVTEFGDLECPACGAAHAQLNIPLLAEYGDKVRFEFKHFPLRSIHRFALDAAEASECAADQGKFWEFVDLVYEHQEDLSFESLLVWAEELQLDTELFERCWKSHVKRDTVLADYEVGKEAGVQGTPTYFINGEQIQTGYDTMTAAIEEALAQPVKRF